MHWINAPKVTSIPTKAGAHWSNDGYVSGKYVSFLFSLHFQLMSHIRWQSIIIIINVILGLLENLTFILPHQKAEIMWRTGTSKEALTPDIAWKRCKTIDLELRKLANALKPFIVAGKTHDEIVDMLGTTFTTGSYGFQWHKPIRANILPRYCYRFSAIVIWKFDQISWQTTSGTLGTCS